MQRKRLGLRKVKESVPCLTTKFCQVLTVPTHKNWPTYLVVVAVVIVVVESPCRCCCGVDSSQASRLVDTVEIAVALSSV
jgi:hypothetical protein